MKVNNPSALQPPYSYPWLRAKDYEWKGTHNGTKKGKFKPKETPKKE
jgi:hypothetical protein